ncbi:MAG: stage II sporulation protein P [Limnochordia bacterium]
MAKSKQPGFVEKKDSPFLTVFLVLLVVVAVLGAKYFGFAPSFGTKAEEDERPGPGAEAPLVLVYTAHPMENYAPAPPHAEGVGDVASVCRHLEQSLQKHGIRAQMVTGQKPVQWRESFTEARRVLLPVMEKAERVSALLDVHRDALEGRPDGYTTVNLSGKPMAKILFVVGDVDNPYIEENLKFAEALRVALEARAPGVTRGVKVLHEALNGDLHPQAVQVYIGEYYDNTLQEALDATSILAEAVADVLQKGRHVN